MARIPVVFNGWEYDDETKHIIAKFSEAPLPDDPDPVNFVSTKMLEVEFLPRIVDESEVEQPEQAQLDVLNIVVDQLVNDMLMGDL